MNFSLGKKIILVEGNAEYILVEKFFEILHSKKPEEFNVSIISVD
ncbi:TOPRIM nucleotidyl transferase/hydrolase domain-containing protein [Streptococcus pneumoniae]